MILASFATIVGVLAVSQVRDGFVASMDTSVQNLPANVGATLVKHGQTVCEGALTDLAISDNAQIRLFDLEGDTLCSSTLGPRGQPLNAPALYPPLTGENGSVQTYQQDGNEVMARWIHWGSVGQGWLVYARPLSQIEQTVSRIRVFLVLGVLGGAILALLAGLYVAQRAMAPITELTQAAREIELTRDPTRRIPHPRAADEVAHLAHTLEGMLGALAAARADSEAALARQREFVADASHELRTPLTAVLANLELLADELDGEQAESAKSALRSTRRMRRLVGDLLLLARADAQREAPRRPVDLAAVLADAAAELAPTSGGHPLDLRAEPLLVEANRDDLHRLILNLIENAFTHTAPGTAVRASVDAEGDHAVLRIEDDGPGIPADLAARAFERFVRGHGDGGRGTGLGLAIVAAVADSHGAEILLTPTHPDGRGTRFTVRLPLIAEVAIAGGEDPAAAGPRAGRADAQISTTTGSTIGRRLRRS